MQAIWNGKTTFHFWEEGPLQMCPAGTKTAGGMSLQLSEKWGSCVLMAAPLKKEDRRRADLVPVWQPPWWEFPALTMAHWKRNMGNKVRVLITPMSAGKLEMEVSTLI